MTSKRPGAFGFGFRGGIEGAFTLILSWLTKVIIIANYRHKKAQLGLHPKLGFFSGTKVVYC
jgi:hypothetical protein